METYFFCGVLLIFVLILLLKGHLDQKKTDEWLRKKLRELKGEASTYRLDPDTLCHIKRFYEKHPGKHQVDDITWNDLDMDLLFERMNYTQSSCGEEYLYYTLRNPVFSEESLSSLEEKIKYFDNHDEKRVDAQLLFLKLGKLGKYSLYDYLDHLDVLGPVLNMPLILWDVLIVAAVLLMIYSVPLGIVALIAVICHNIFAYFKKKKEIEPYITSFSFIFSMLSTLQDLIGTLDTPLFLQEVETMKRCNQAMKGFKRGSFLVMKPRNRDLGGNPLEILIDYACMIFFVDLLKFNQMLSVVRERVEQIEQCLSVIGSLETEISIALYRASLKNGYCIPTFGEDRIGIVECYHPLIKTPVKNTLENGSNILLTGSNASGKSTFLKTVALNLIFAQTIHTCTADSFGTGFYEVLSSMSLKDSISEGDSYYIAEIKAIKRIFDKIKENEADKIKVVCFLDEVLRGTNTIERIAGAAQILKAIANTDSYCFAATHDIELTEILEAYYINYHFEESIENNDIHFSYELLDGKAKTRNAIKLLQCMGFDDSLIEEAEKRAECFLTSGQWMN